MIRRQSSARRRRRTLIFTFIGAASCLMVIPYFVIIDDQRSAIISSPKSSTTNFDDEFNMIDCLLGESENGTEFGIEEESKSDAKQQKNDKQTQTKVTNETDDGGSSGGDVYDKDELIVQFEPPKLLRGLKNAKKMCPNHVEMLVLIVSKFDEYTDRDIVRRTWAAPINTTRSISVLFVVGVDQKYFADKQRNVSAYIADKKSLRDEMAKNDDILLIDVLEDFHNLSLKTYGAFDVVNQRCSKVQCVVKADSDTVLHLPMMLKMCRESKDANTTGVIRGHCFNEKPIRDSTNKWFVPEFVFSDKTYPMYCSGSAYLMVGKNVTKRLITGLKQTKFANSTNFRKLSEDMLFTGISAENAKIQRESTTGFSRFNEKSYHCFSDLKLQYIITTHYVRGLDKTKKTWHSMQTAKAC